MAPGVKKGVERVYLDHWSLQRNPFEAQSDSRFLFATEQHAQALAAISYAACDGGESRRQSRSPR